MTPDTAPVGRPHGNRLVPADVPAIRCLNCRYVWHDRPTPRVTRTMCPRCKTIRPGHFESATLPGYRCTKCDILMYARPGTAKAGRVHCKKCGTYLAPGMWGGRRKRPAA